MSDPSIEPGYDRVAKTLHWLVFLLIGIQFILGWSMPDVNRDTLPVGWVGAHITVGTLILLSVAMRILWRLLHQPPVMPHPSSWSARLARLVHACLYVLMGVVPVFGWANANARGWVVGVTDSLSLPTLMVKGSALGHDLGDWHSNLAVVFIVLIGLHVVGGLYHHMRRRDGTLRRMWPL